ncbi:MAG: outer membrane beta-barrel protein [Acidobacteriota bacterium]
MNRHGILNRERSRPAVFATAIGAFLALALLPDQTTAQSSSDFLFVSPGVTLSVYGGYALPGAESDIFDFTTTDLTADRSDFGSLAFGGRLGIRVNEHLDIALDLGHSRAEADTEYREWVDLEDRPIEQTTTFSRTPATLNLEVHPWERGRSIGRFVWIPRRLSPYVGAGAGLMWYDFTMRGDFVDFETQDIFRSTFESTDRTLAGQVFAGLDVSISPRFLLDVQVQHVWASTEMDRDFEDVDPIDLSGFQTTVGIAVRL